MTPRPPEPTERFFFLHMQKTAGTALWQRMLDSMPRQSLYPGHTDGAPPEVTIVVDQLLDAWRRRRHEIRIVTGHFPLCCTELLDADFRTFTIVRDPVERTLSSLRHYRELTPELADVPLEEIYDDPLRRLLIRNQMVKMLSLTVEEMTEGVLSDVAFGPGRLTAAKRALETIEVVGTQDAFEPFCAELSRRFGWDLGRARYANRSTPTPVDERFRRRIADDQVDDMDLYEHARTLAVR